MDETHQFYWTGPPRSLFRPCRPIEDNFCYNQSASNTVLTVSWTWSMHSSSFYRVTRMHSADYAVARCLSACLSHAGIVSKRLYISSKFFSPSGSPTILVFLHQTGWQYSDGDPSNGGVECKRVWISHDFRPMSCFISALMQDRAIVTTEGE